VLPAQTVPTFEYKCEPLFDMGIAEEELAHD
jgi:hypothetical protein